MKPILLSVLCCPACSGSLRVLGSDDAIECREGTLVCDGCGLNFPIRQGVPNMVLDREDARRTKSNFQHQWEQRFLGRAESRATIFGYDVYEFAGWLCSRYGEGLYRLARQRKRAWCLDAGCGTAEKTAQFAKFFPFHQVIAMDISDTLVQSARHWADVPNLHFVQADLRFPPLRRASFDFVMSIAALHHTPDTRAAFNSVASVTKGGGVFVTWIYPKPGEYPSHFFRWHYLQRDWLFLRSAHRLPPKLGMLICRLHVALLFPFVLPMLKRLDPFGRLIKKHNLSLRQIYDSAVFFTYDNVMPPNQYRHSIQEVTGWYEACGFVDVSADRPGVFSGKLRVQQAHMAGGDGMRAHMA